MFQKRIQEFLLVLSISHGISQFAARHRIQSFKPPPISLKQRFCLYLTRCFAYHITHFEKFLLQSKELITIVIAPSRLGSLFRCPLWHRLTPIAPHMTPTSAADHTVHQVVSGIAVCYQTAGETFQKRCRVLAAAIRLVFEVSNRFTAAVIAGIHPHTRLARGGLSLLLQHLHHSLVCMNYGTLQKSLFHAPVQWFQPGLRALDHPVGHRGTGKADPLPFPNLFLSGQRQSVHILLRHHICHCRRGCQRMLHQHGRRHCCNDIGIAGLRLTVLARIAAAVIFHHIALTGDDFQSPGNQLLSNHLILAAALVADKFIVGKRY